MTIPEYIVAIFIIVLAVSLIYLINVTDKLSKGYKDLSTKIDEKGVEVILEFKAKEKALLTPDNVQESK